MMNFDTLPNPNLADGIEMYIDHGIEPGSFLQAVLRNDLQDACFRADHINRLKLVDLMKWLFNEMPDGTWGSESAYRMWVESGGIKGHSRQRQVEDAA